MRSGLAMVLLASAVATAVHAAEEKSNMELVGYNDLQARSAYQPIVQKQGERWIAYVGHHGGSQPNALTGKPEAIRAIVIPEGVTEAHRVETSERLEGRRQSGVLVRAEHVGNCALNFSRFGRSPFPTEHARGHATREIDASEQLLIGRALT